MGKLSEFVIVFDKNCKLFHPGQTVSGSVVMALTKPMKMKGIKLTVQGKAWCFWSETHAELTTYYQGSESLLGVQVWIHGNSTKFTNEAGRFSYPFNFVLPLTLPSSFEGSHGFIRYHISAEIDKPWKVNLKTTTAFGVHELIDTNLPIYNSVRPSGSTHKNVGCCCCTSGPLELTVSIDRRAYCPGEHILITAKVQNNTTTDMNGMIAKLYRHVEYCGKAIVFKKFKTTSEKIAIMKSGLADTNQLSPVIDQQPVNPKLLSQPPPKNYGSMNKL
ncbi:arrestin domain-containing protein 3-like isoform X2 [Hydra vulgaris]|uniref:Arrestin domain-containing protein 3-like isoform X2 n=1 Tax=Hydra vulgaris TaxID=6087 RepID=A0ABM4C4H4_HYDVU